MFALQTFDCITYIAIYADHPVYYLEVIKAVNETLMTVRSVFLRSSRDLVVVAEKVINFHDCHRFGMLNQCEIS